MPEENGNGKNGNRVGLLERVGVDSAEVDNVVAGCAYQLAEQSMAERVTRACQDLRSAGRTLAR